MDPRETRMALTPDKGCAASGQGAHPLPSSHVCFWSRSQKAWEKVRVWRPADAARTPGRG